MKGGRIDFKRREGLATTLRTKFQLYSIAIKYDDNLSYYYFSSSYCFSSRYRFSFRGPFTSRCRSRALCRYRSRTLSRCRF